MTCEQAGYTSMREFHLRIEGYQQRQRDEWDLARWQMFLAMQMHPYIKKENKAKTPQEWIEFAWERKQEEEKDLRKYILTDEQKGKMLEKFDKLKNK